MGRKAHIRERKKGTRPALSPSQLIVRCFAERKGDVWQAFCLEFNLAAQGGSFHEVRRKLHEQIDLYLIDILEGDDRQFADQLLNRKAPLAIRSRYHFYKAMRKIIDARDGLGRIFTEVMPLTLADRHA
ncbi:MAG: hypothetical protein EHM79_02120 [Geobacter sp.]|nr:MAG: hypothetical protein EHM79_02120 [Geobacter sp.]